MTCIVGVQHTKGVIIGADSFMGNEVRMEHSAAKIWEAEGWIFAGSGDERFLQAVQFVYRPKPAMEIAVGTELAHIINKMALELVSLCRDRGMLKKDKVDSTDQLPGQLMVACHGKLFTIHSDLAVITAKSGPGHTAIGSGKSYALGSLHTTRHRKDHRKRVIQALLAAEYLSPMVRRPWTIKEQYYLG